MSNVTGKDGRVMKQVSNVDTLIAGVKSWTIDYGVDLIDVTAFGATEVTAKSYLAALKDCTGSFNANHTDDAEPLTVGSEYNLMLDVTSNLSYFGVVKITGKGANAVIDGEVTQEYSFQYTDPSSLATSATLTGSGQLPPVLILGANVIVNGTFTADTNWTHAGNWTIADGNASIDGSQVTADLLEAAVDPLTALNYYYTNYQVLQYVEGNVQLSLANSKTTARSANGYYTEICVAIGEGFAVQADADLTALVDNIVVREILNL